MKKMLTIFFLLLMAAMAPAADPPKLKLLFLGDKAGHAPATRFRILEPVLQNRGITLTYTEKLEDINAENLAKFDGLVIYANHGQGKPEQVKAILDYVAAGKGFIPLHCASYCFIDNKDYVDLVGAQFRSHTTGVFRVRNTKPDHPILQGYSGFESWDETYTHTKHNEKDRTVLEVRTDGDVNEPWTWTRTHGKGRVFYTAWGHDHRTWGNPGFQNLVERGIRWACGQDPSLAGTFTDAPKMTAITGPKDDFEYVPAKIPFYPPSKTWGVIADPITKMQKPLTPEKSIKHYSTPEGFELKLFAADADFMGGKPICMTWDERGRLWAAVTVDYPNELQREGDGRDKIVILEDTNGDGRADKSTIFAEKLSIPTSLTCARGGVIVHQAPHTLFLKDTNGDDQADVRQVLFSGWGTGDTHAGPSNLRYGFDNWFYGSVGYSGFNGTVNGERLNFRQGYYRFRILEKPNGELTVDKLEFLRSTSNNTWGLAFSEDGQLFGSTANGCVLVHMPIPNRYYEQVRGLTPSVLAPIALDNHIHPITEKVRQVDWHGGFTAASNCAIYTARVYPPEYWNKTAFVSEPTGHLTATFTLQSNGTEFTARNAWNLVASDDEWAAPIDAQVGPDGNMWVLDWYNFIVQHNPTPKGFTTGKGNAYETELRDKKHGRIYRLVHTKGTPEPPVNLKDAPADTLVETLKHPNLLWRQHAQRILVERQKSDVTAKLIKLIEDKSVDASGLNPGAIHAIWTLAGIGNSHEIETQAFSHPSPAVVRAGLQALPIRKLEPGWPNTLDPQTRLAFFLAFAKPNMRNGTLDVVNSVLDSQSYSDRNLADALAILAIQQGKSFLVPLSTWAKSTPKSDALPAQAYSLITLAARQMAESAKPNEAETMIVVINQSAQHPQIVEAILSGFSAGWPKELQASLDAETVQTLGKLISKLTGSPRSKLLKLASVWGVKGLDAQLAEVSQAMLVTVADAKADDTARLDAAKQIIEFRPDDEAIAIKLLDATSSASPQLAIGLLDVLATAKVKNIGPALVAKLGILPPTARPAALRLILARPEPTKAYLDAVEAGKLRFDMLALDQRTALAAHPEKTISERAKKLLALGGGLPDPNRQKVIEEFASILKKSGDTNAGKKVFTTHCAKCHKHSGEGQTIGPDLSGFAVHPKEEILIHVLDPSRSVEGNYKAYTAKLLDGRVVSGLLASETKTSVELLDAENKRHAIARDDLEELKESPKSLMPEGFEKTIKIEELTDLLEFMTLKGKYVPIPLDKVATIVSTKGMFFEESGTTERMIFRDWSPKTFEGVPFVLVDPQGDKIKNVILLNGPNGLIPPKMPKSVTIPCNTATKAIHLLSGVGGWNYPAEQARTVSMIVRLHYADGKTEEHPLRNGVHFADYIRRVDVAESKFAFALRGQQLRYLAVTPKRTDTVIKQIEFVKGPDRTAPIVMAVTVETP